MHIWRHCEKVKVFWNGILEELKKICKYNIKKYPEFFLLGIVGDDIKKQDEKISLYATAAARILLAKYWKREEIPNIKEWQEKLLSYVELDKITNAIRGCNNKKFAQNWVKFGEYFKKQCPMIKTWTYL